MNMQWNESFSWGYNNNSIAQVADDDEFAKYIQSGGTQK